MILQQANHLDEAEIFAQLKEFVLASCDETPTSNTQQFVAQVIEKLLIHNKTISMKVGKCDESLEKNSSKLWVKNLDISIVFQDNFAIVEISLVLIVVKMNTRNVTARRMQTRNVTMSVKAREQVSHWE